MAEAAVTERASAAEERVYVAPQWLLMWWRFRKHKLAMASAVILALFYMVAIGAEFLGTNDPGLPAAKDVLVPPQRVHLFDGLRPTFPYVYPIIGRRDPETLKKIYDVDKSEKIRLRFFARGFEYKFLGRFRTDRHLIGVGGERADGSPIVAEDVLYLLGTDTNGRDLWSRLMLATRLSLSIGLAGVGLSLVIGILLGGISGYFGGVTDTIIQRFMEILMSIPGIPLWMVFSATLPRDWSIIKIYFAITVILSLLGWTGLARAVRGKFLAVRAEDFVMAAQLAGASKMRIMFRHMLPSFYSHIIATATLSVPGMIIGETALSFLGLGLRPPAVSYGVMLQQAQNVQVVALSPWLMIPAIPVIVVVLAFNFMGDGIRDAADPYGE